ncbi:unnamed protein product [Caenorhabditis auriculariae]|uniref:Uncharacterized protein n=1 Tax=Caenorhabditis auriculariae TaxID=2777116 RepID=A0A8S1H4G7_9PELO|nr:unnamed protein product [Caenorhabditis auriculariae]
MRRTSRKKNLTDNDKRAIVVGRQNGLTMMTLAGMFGVTEACISQFLKLWKAQDGSTKSQRTGRSRVTDGNDDRNILKTSRTNPRLTAPTIRREVFLNSPSPPSVSTVKRRLNAAGIMRRRPVKKPLISEKNRAARVKWAKEHLNWTRQGWNKILWSDENKFLLFGSDGIQWDRFVGPQNLVPVLTGPVEMLLRPLHPGGSILFRNQRRRFTVETDGGVGEFKKTSRLIARAANLVAEHSRKTFRPRDVEVETIENLLSDVQVDSGEVNSKLRDYTSIFADTARDQLTHEEDENIFKKLWYDKSYKVHDLCEPHNSGHQTGELIWTESGDRLLKVIGNGVVKDGYNMFMAPGQSQGRRTDVHVAVYIESMSSFKAQTMDFEVDMYLAMGWFDRRLAHNCTHPILVTSKLIADRMWYPDLYFVNSKFAYLQEVTTPNLMVIVYPDGLIFKSMRLDVTLSCMMDLKLFPLDYQECPLTIQSFAYIEQIVNLTWHNDPPFFPIGSNEEIKLNDMTITRTRFEKCAGPYPMFRGTAYWSCIRAYIVMKRLVLFHIIQTYIPTGMLVSISWMSFWLDPRASPARISLTITSLLTLTTMSNGARQDLPQVSYIKALDIWLTFSQALIFLVLLEYSFVSYYITKRTFDCPHRTAFNHQRLLSTNSKPAPADINRNEEQTEEYPFAIRKVRSYSHLTEATPTPSPRLNGQKPRTAQFSLTHGLSACMNNSAALMSATPHAAAHIYSKFDFTKPCQKCALRNEHIARKIDRYSRWLFPSVFTIFCLAYWLYFTWRSSLEQTK